MKERVVVVNPGDILHMTGQAGPDGVLWSWTSDEDDDEVTVFKAHAAFVRFEMVLRLKDKGGGRGEHRLTTWAKRALGLV